MARATITAKAVKATKTAKTKTAKPKVTETKTNVSGLVDSVEALDSLIKRVKKAQIEFSTYSQEQVDKIFKAAAVAANRARIPLAKMAVDDTGMGVVEDKIIKNHFASEYIYNKHKDAKTCGIIKVDKNNGIKIVAENRHDSNT